MGKSVFAAMEWTENKGKNDPRFLFVCFMLY